MAAPEEFVLMFDTITSIMALVHNTLLFTGLLYFNRNDFEISKSNILRNSLLYITYLTILSSLFLNGANVAVVFVNLDLLPCDYWNTFITVAYHLSRYFIWCFAIFRLKLVFQKTPNFQYSSKFLNTLIIVFFLISSGLMINISFSITNHQETSEPSDVILCPCMY